MKQFIADIILTKNYVLEEMEEKIHKMYIVGKLTSEEMAELLIMAAENAEDDKQIDVVSKLADLERRLEVLESAGVVVWVQGMSTAKGQTVLYDIEKNGILRYCRYDGGRTSTALSPGKIEGWVILSGANGEITHRVDRDENGEIILVPVEL